MSRAVIVAVRYGLPAAVVLAGLIALVVNPATWEGSAALIGAGLSISLLNVLFRIGVQGDEERGREAEARAYFDAHGRWPDEPPVPAQRTSDSRP